METLDLKSTKTKWKKSVVELNSTYEQAKGIWELEEGCIDIQSGEEKKKWRKMNTASQTSGTPNIYQYNRNGSSRGMGSEKRAGKK